MSKKLLEKLNGNVELYENINSLVDEMKKRDFYPIESFKHKIDTGVSEWYTLMLKGKKGFPIGEHDFVTVDINEDYMNVNGKYCCAGEMDLSEGDFVELFFSKFSEYEKMCMEIKKPLGERYDKVVNDVSRVIGEDYIVVPFRDTFVFYIRHRELNCNAFRFELLDDVDNWFVQGFPYFKDKFDRVYGELDISGEDEFNSLKERVGSLFNQDCE